MRTLITSFMALLLCFALPMGDAHAKKLGGGFSLGKSYSTPSKPAAPGSANTSGTSSNTAAKQQDSTANAAAPAAKPRSGFGGLMGGLLAGGLLGALFFGGAFEGIQIMDVLLVALVGFILFKLFMSRRTQAQPQPAYAGAGEAPTGAAPQWGQQAEPVSESRFEPKVPVATYSGGLGSQLGAQALNLPAWFNKNAFLEQACSHFTHLQSAWDRQDWDEIGSYTSPELFEALKKERAGLPAEQQTKVESVMADLVNFIEEGDQVVVSIHFYGWIREDEASGTTEFGELWHLSRDMSTENADWFIVGIEQL